MISTIPREICIAFGITLAQLFAEEGDLISLTDPQKKLLVLAPGDRNHILPGVFNQFLSANPRASRINKKSANNPALRLVILSLLPAQL